MNHVSHHVVTYVLLAVVLAGWVALAYRLDVRRRDDQNCRADLLARWNRDSDNPLYRRNVNRPLRQIEASSPATPLVIDGEYEQYEGIGAKALTAADTAWLAQLVRDDAPGPNPRVMAPEPLGPPTEDEYYTAYYAGAFAELDGYLATFVDRRLSVLLDPDTHLEIAYEQNAIEREWDAFTIELDAIVKAEHLAEALLVS